MEDVYVAITHLGQRALHLLASTLRALRRLPAADAWLWMAGTTTSEPAAAFSVVLLHRLSGLLLATGPEIFHHG